MTSNRGPDTHRLKWIATLAALVYPQEVSKAADALKAFLHLLADLPDGAFSAASLEAVVMAPRRMAIPSYDELRGPLAQWWQSHGMPGGKGLDLTDQRTSHLTSEQQAYFAQWKKARSEGRATAAFEQYLRNEMPPVWRIIAAEIGADKPASDRQTGDMGRALASRLRSQDAEANEAWRARSLAEHEEAP